MKNQQKNFICSINVIFSVYILFKYLIEMLDSNVRSFELVSQEQTNAAQDTLAAQLLKK